jgi:hypothetical protein
MRQAWIPALLLAAAACGGRPSSGAAGPAPAAAPPPELTASPCDGDAPPGGLGRRFEARLETGPGSAELRFDGRPALSSTAGGGAACQILELSPGVHQIDLAAQGDSGVGLRIGLSSQHPDRPDRYDVFSLACGVPGVCAREQLQAWRQAIQDDRTRMHDPCSATQIRDIRWDSERIPGTDQLSALRLSFTLSVYAQPFDSPPRDPGCPTN